MGSFRRHQTFSSTTPQFFHIILEDTSKDIKLKIPKNFVMKYGADISNSACLKLPSSEEWQVELTRCNGNVWFEKGWLEFSKFFSLDYGDFLVFRYEGSYVFQVCIFDRTATEIDYPITMAPGMEKTDHEDEEDDDISIQILEDSPPRPEKRKNSTLQPSPSCKKMRTSKSDKLAVDMMVENDVGGSSTTRKCFERTLENQGEFRSLNNEEKARALLSAEAFISEKAYFKIVMQPSYVQQSYLRLPSKFLKENRMKDAPNVTLRVSNGKTWSVKLKKYDKSRAILLHGWLAFVKDNCLKVGDVCVFILIKDINHLFQVEIFRATSFPILPGKVESDCGIHCDKNNGSETSGEVAERQCPEFTHQFHQGKHKGATGETNSDAS